MLILGSTLRSIKAVLGGAVTTNQLDCTSQFRDIRDSKTSVSWGSHVVNTNNTTAVTITPAPSSGVNREIFTITVYNKDTAAATLTIYYDDNGTTYTVFKSTLSVGDTVIYSADDGWVVFDSTGNRKTA